MNTVANFVPTIVGGVKTMNSKDIAVYTGKLHNNVIRDIREMLSKIQNSEMSPVKVTTDFYQENLIGFYQENFLANKMTASFDLDEELTLTLVSGYDVVMRRSIISAWKTAEEALKKPVALLPNFDDPIAAAEAWITEKKAVLALTANLEEAQPMIDFHQAVVADDSVYGLAEAAKVLNIAPRKFNTWLRDNKYVMSNLVPYERWKVQGILVSRFSGYLKPNGTTAPATTYVTSKGIAYFQKQLSK